MADTEQTNLTSLTVDLLSAYFANNTVDSEQLSGLIRSTHDALKGIDSPEPEVPAEPEFKPATTVRKSLASPDHIISLVDGRPYKTLKRHLSGHGLTPAQYRERYKLPADYPMVAPAYSQQRREVAAKLGLGGKRRAITPPPVEVPVEPEAAPAPEFQTKAAPKAKTAKTIAAKPRAVPKPAPVKKSTAAKAKAVSSPAEPAPAIEAPVESAAVASPAPAPKKAGGRKPKSGGAVPAVAETSKAPTKRAPRKSKTASEPAAE
jgi:predicted transcriptional regulator